MRLGRIEKKILLVLLDPPMKIFLDEWTREDSESNYLQFSGIGGLASAVYGRQAFYHSKYGVIDVKPFSSGVGIEQVGDVSFGPRHRRCRVINKYESRLSQSIKSLVEKGLIESSLYRGGSSNQQINLTDEGKEMASKIKKDIQSFIEEWSPFVKVDKK